MSNPLRRRTRRLGHTLQQIGLTATMPTAYGVAVSRAREDCRGLPRPDTLITGGVLAARWGLPEEWRGKLQADLEEYVTIEWFPMAGSATSASTAIRHHVDAVLAPYHEAKKKEEERERAREAAARAAEERRCALISYGCQLLENELASWASDDPKDEARREVDLVLRAEVRPDWDEQKVRELVTELLDQYE